MFKLILSKVFTRRTSHPLVETKLTLHKINQLGGLIGVDILRKNYKYRLSSYITWLVVIMYLPLTTIFMQRYSRELKNVIMAMTTVGVWAQGCSRLYIIVHCKRLVLCDLINFIVNIYIKNQKAERHVINRFTNCSTICTNIMKFFFLACAIFGPLIFFLWPIIQTVFFGEISLALGILLPFINPETVFGYMATMILQLFYTFVAIVGNCAADLLMIYNILHITLLVDLFNESFNELDKRLNGGNFTWDNKFDYLLNNIIKRHQDIVSFLDTLRKLSINIFLVQYATSSFNLAISLVSIVIVSDWWSAYGIIALSITQFLIFCGLGTLVEMNIEKIQSIIYNSQWYHLPANQQKKIMIMLMRANVTEGLTIGGYLPLNVDSGTQILQLIYKYFMMFVQVLE